MGLINISGPLYILCMFTICFVCSEKSNKTYLMTKLAILKHYPEFYINSTDILNPQNLKSIFDKLLIDLKKLNGVTEIKMNCTSDDDDDDKLCNTIFSSKCLAIEDMISLLPNNNETTIAALNELCPLLLFQTHEKSCKVQDKPLKQKTRPTSAAVWGFGILFVTIISCCSLVGVVLLPLLNQEAYHAVLMLFEGLAVGSLISSAVFHLIPQAFNLLGEDVHHDYLWKSLIIFIGIYVFFLTDRFMKFFIHIRKKKSQKKAEKYSPVICTNITTVNGIISSPNGNQAGPITLRVPSCEIDENNLGGNDHVKQIVQSQETEVHSNNSHTHNHDITFVQGQDSAIGTVAWMIIFGDGLHNFIDGLSIGAAFSESILAGISISVAVLCEEFPHELGDFAVLLSAGMTMKQALMYNFLSACTCYLGLVFGVLLGDLAEGSHYIFAFAGGMFIYISLVGMMGELNEALDTAQNKGIKKLLNIFLLQNIGIIIGVVVLFVMARYSENINFDVGSENKATEYLTEISKAMGNDHYNLKALYQL